MLQRALPAAVGLHIINNMTPEAAASPLIFSAGSQWVVFSVDAARYALPLAAVERVVRAAQFTPLPLAPEVVLGVIDIAGHIFPVFNMRRRLRLPERPLLPSDQFLIARTRDRTVVLAIDTALGVIEQPGGDLVEAARLTHPLPQIRGVIRLEDGLVLVQDLEQFLSADEAGALSRAVRDYEASHAG